MATRAGDMVPHRRGVVVLTVLALAATALVLLTAVPMPHMGDQALFQLGADELRSGGVLYVDFWDLKQPGVFWFFSLADVVRVDPHVLELVWALGLAALAISVARTYTTDFWTAPLAAVTCVAWPYAVANTQVLTQVELLAGLPMLGALAAARAAVVSDSRAVRDVASGLVGVCVVALAMLKVMLLGPLLAALVVLLWALPATTRPRFVRSGLIAAAVGIGLTGLVLLSLALQGAFADAMRTWFIVPLGAGSRAGRSTERLVETFTDFARWFAPLIVLGAIGAWRMWRRRDPVGLAAIAWLVTGVLTVIAQLGWYYLMSLVAVPVGLLAVGGVEAISDLVRRRRSVAVGVLAVVALIVLALPAAMVLGGRVQRLVEADGALTASNRDAFRAAQDELWAARTAQADSVRVAMAPDDTIVLWGDPLVLELAGKSSAISVHGWSPEHLDQTLWQRAADEMREAQPDLVLVDEFSAQMIAERGSAVGDVLDDGYEVDRDDQGFTWYVRQS